MPPWNKHPEAFCLMTYKSDDGREAEVIWNSRDGVTPFVITLKSGRAGRHVEWHKDAYAPAHRPKVGDRIFRNMTRAEAKVIAERVFERMDMTPVEFQINILMTEIYNKGQAPFLHTVTEEEAELWN